MPIKNFSQRLLVRLFPEKFLRQEVLLFLDVRDRK